MRYDVSRSKYLHGFPATTSVASQLSVIYYITPMKRNQKLKFKNGSKSKPATFPDQQLDR